MAAETELTTLQITDYRKRLKKHKKVFRKCMEYQYGLGAKIEKIFSEEETAKIKKKKSKLDFLDFNAFLLKELRKRTEKVEYEVFMEALSATFQSHLVNQIITNGEFTEGDINIPLTDNQRKLIRHKKDAIVDQLHTVVVEAASRCKDKCINQYHYQHITQRDLTDLERAEEMVDIVKNRSVEHVQSIRKVLEDQGFTLCNLLDIGAGGASIIPVKVMTVAKKNLKEIEKILNSCLPGKIIEGSTVISAQPDKCVLLHLRCPTPESLQILHDSVNTERMKAVLQNLFNEIIGSADTITVTRVFAGDICFMKFYQQCVLESVDMSDNMYEHPLLRNGQLIMERVFKSDKTLEKIKECIVLKAYVWRMAKGRKLYSRPDLEACETLSSVCHDWRKIAEHDSFKKAVKTSRKQLKKKYQSITLECMTRITIDQEITCISSLLDEVYVGTKENKNSLYLYDYNKFESTEPMQQEPAQSSHEESVERPAESTSETGGTIIGPVAEVRSEATEVSPGVGKGKKPKIVQHVGKEKLEKIEIADDIDILSVESVDDQTGLFCINRSDNSVWFWARSEARNKATAFKQFSPCTNITISPMEKGNLRIVVLKDRNAVEMHNPSSELIQMMFLPDHVVKVNDILCNQDGLLIVSYGSETNPLHRVSLIHRTGLKALLTYGNECGSGANELNNPCSITLDQENEILYVVDKGNERIVALDKNMDLINVVLDSKYNGMGSPIAVRFSKGSQRLLVAYKESVEVFKVKRKLQPQQQEVQPQQQEVQRV